MIPRSGASRVSVTPRVGSTFAAIRPQGFFSKSSPQHAPAEGGCGPMCAACVAEIGWKGIIPRHQAALVRASWDEMSSKHTYNQMAETFFDTLFASHPQVENLFYRACAGAQMFEAMTTKLLSVMVDCEAGSRDLNDIGVRHLRYNVKMNLFPKAGKELMTVFEELSAPGTFTPEVREAWMLLWTNCSKLFEKYLAVDPVVRAIARGALLDIQKKLELTPREFRVQRLLQKLADGQTPLQRGIRTRKTNIIKFMLKDILTIRSDRSGYYYGRKELFEVHPDIVTELVEHSPESVTELLDGCRWESIFLNDGHHRVNYYIEGLYGRPDQPVSETPLAALLKSRKNDIFTHPVTIMLIHLKWKQFGRTKFLFVQALGILKLILFILGYLVVPRKHTVERAVLNVLVFILCGRDFYEMAKVVGLYDKTFRDKWLDRTVPLREKLTRTWKLMATTKWLRLTADTLIIAMIPFNPLFRNNKVEREIEEVLMAMAIVSLFTVLLRGYLADHRMSAFTHTISKMVGDVIQWFCVFTFVWIGFAMSFYIMLGTRGYAEFINVWTCMLSLFGMAFGFYEFEFRDKEDTIGIVATLMWLLYLIFVILLMVNLLIAQFASSYEIVKEAAYAVTMRKMAEEIVVMENSLTRAQREKIWASMELHRPLEFDEGDPGPTGGVQELEHIQSLNLSQDDRVLRFRGRADPEAPWPAYVPASALRSTVASTGGSAGGSAGGSLSTTPRKLSPRSSMSQALGGSTGLKTPTPNEQLKSSPSLVKPDFRRRVVEKAAMETMLDPPEADPFPDTSAKAPRSRLGGAQSPVTNSSSAGQQQNAVPNLGPSDFDSSRRSTQESSVRSSRETNSNRSSMESVDNNQPYVKDGINAYELAAHNHEGDAWIAIHGEVYDITEFISLHPGGDSFLPYLGGDGTEEFENVGHSKYADALMKKYRIDKYVG